MKRDAAPVESLFQAHAPDLLRYLRRRVGPDAAEDLLAETFLALLRRGGAADPERGGDRAWLFGVAANLVCRHARDASRAAVAEHRVEGRSPVTVDPLADVAGRLDAASDVRALAGALRDLDADDREVLLLVAWAGLSPSEAAAALGIPAGTARSRLHRVRAQVRAAAAALVDHHQQEES